MDIQKITPEQLNEEIAVAKAAEDIAVLRKMADGLELSYSGNTGVPTLQGKVVAALEELLDAKTTDVGVDKPEPVESPTMTEADALENLLGADEPMEEIQVSKPQVPTGPTAEELLKMDPNTVEDPILRRAVVRAKAMKLLRVRVINLDPSDSNVHGTIISLRNKYTGKVSKLIPFGDETDNGYHITQMMYDHLVNKKFALRKEVKGGKVGVKRYKTTMVPKFNVTVLPPLTKEEVKDLADHQRASNAIDKED